MAMLVMLNIGFGSCACKYFVASKTAPTDYLAPDTCYQQKVNGVTQSWNWECASDGQSVTGKYWPGSDTCDGDAKINSTLYKKDGYDMNCDSTATDCSSVYRTYNGCDVDNDDYFSLPIVMGMCQEALDGFSEKWECTSTSETISIYQDSNCEAYMSPLEYKNGCQGDTYYQIESCHS